MPARPILLVVAALVALCAGGASPAFAQQYDDEWLDSCRRENHWDRGDDRYKHCEVREDSLRAPGGTLRVDPGVNGGVSVRGWDADSLYVRARIQTNGATQDEAVALAREIKIVIDGATIRAVGPEGRLGRHRGWSVSFEVYVPRHTDLALETVNGPVAVREVTGRMDLEAQNGPVVLRGVGGAVRARVENGPLTVVLTGARWDGSGLDAETINGPVDLVVPEGYSAQLETGTVNGPMSIDFPLTVTIQGRVSRRINSTLGAGGVLVRVVTTNGPLSIRRR